ncbi:MAG: hypothetical protein HQK60_06210, partial [Deltaproteobacteria bacterium]|nr:hypothetical protein [Deltaproteobacteria bacterium]
MRRFERDFVSTESDKDKKYLLSSVASYKTLLTRSKLDKNALALQESLVNKYEKALDEYFTTAEGGDKSQSLKTISYRGIKMISQKIENSLTQVYLPRATELLLNIRVAGKNYLNSRDKKHVQATHGAIERLKAAIKDSGLLEDYALTVQKALDEYQATFDSVVTKDEEVVSLTKTMAGAANKIKPLIDTISRQATESAGQRAQGTTSAAKNYTAIAVGSGFVAVIVAILLSFFITRGITRPINRIIQVLSAGADRVASASLELSSNSQQLADGSSQQAASVEETSSALEEMSSITKQNADNARQAVLLMGKANQVVEEANGIVIDLTASMRKISQASEETSKIIKTIDEIAFQTNLLALNAAVEAARAGEAGAG